MGGDTAISPAKKAHDVFIVYKGNKMEADRIVTLEEEAGVKCASLLLNLKEISTSDNFIKTPTSTMKEKYNIDKFDFLINNAGMSCTILFEKANEEDFDEFLNVHYKSVYFLTQKCLPLINESRSIINLSTGTTRFADPGYSIYATMKGVLEVFTKYLAKQLGARGITQMQLHPVPLKLMLIARPFILIHK